ncbi:MAG: ABC transporter substrate-binding protein [Actinobacteria bacterium]|nr:ABC transporter substrate-binding protein [Actinomycetota bacterium]
MHLKQSWRQPRRPWRVRVGLLYIVLLSLVVGLLGGCTSETSPSSTGASAPSTEAPATTQPPTTEATTRVLTDMAGREVVVPAKVERVFSAIPIGTVLLYTLDPAILCAKNFDLSDMERLYTVDSYQALPVMGTYIVGDTTNIEELLELKPDVVLYAGFINDQWKTQVYAAQKRLGIPVVMVDSALDKTPETYTLIGELIGQETRAKELSDYCKNTIDEAKQISATIDSARSIYYAAGEVLSTYAKGSIHSELIDFVGGDNVVVVESKSPFARVTVVWEQLLNWNPDMIITNSPHTRGGAASDVRTELLTNSKYSDMTAVQNSEVFTIPCAPFNWFGEPPSVARILGIKWLGSLMYPDKYDYDMVAETKAFYSKFYHLELTDAQFDQITENSLR